jgi:hypothetical protein
MDSVDELMMTHLQQEEADVAAKNDKKAMILACLL